jgi:hypothetical protein
MPFKNDADMHPTDLAKARGDIRVHIADFGLPDFLAIVAETVASEQNLYLPEIREILKRRAEGKNANTTETDSRFLPLV